ncbi:helix-turn-helix transcriptional regulator [Actinomycetes bacterium KLBMP 9759]
MIDIGADEATTPSAAKRRMGAALKDARVNAGLSLDEAGSVIQRSAATLSRLERGRLQKPRVVDVTALLDHYIAVKPGSVDDTGRSQLLRLARHAAEPAWFAEFRDVLGGPMTADDAQRYIEFENDASAIRTFEPEMMPGLLQTRGYAEAVVDAFFATYTARERSRFVELRLARQQILDRSTDPLRFDVVLGEVALRRRVASDDAMREQLQFLLDHASGKRPHVSIRIAPIELGHPALFGGPFVVMDLADPDENGLVYLETRAAPQFDQSDDVVDRYRQLHANLSAAVLDTAQSRDLIEEVLNGLG